MIESHRAGQEPSRSFEKSHGKNLHTVSHAGNQLSPRTLLQWLRKCLPRQIWQWASLGTPRQPCSWGMQWSVQEHFVVRDLDLEYDNERFLQHH